MPRKRPLPLLGTIGLVHAVTLAVQQQWLQAPEVAEPLASEIGGRRPGAGDIVFRLRLARYFYSQLTKQ